MKKLMRWVREIYEGYDGFARYLFVTGVGALTIGIVLAIFLIIVFAASPIVLFSAIIVVLTFFVSYLFGSVILGD